MHLFLRRGTPAHARLRSRLTFVFLATLVVDLVGSILVYLFERHANGTDISTLGDAFFWTSAQLLTVSSQIRNPFTTGGRVVDIVLEAYAIVVVTTVADFFHHRREERQDAQAAR